MDDTKSGNTTVRYDLKIEFLCSVASENGIAALCDVALGRAEAMANS